MSNNDRSFGEGRKVRRQFLRTLNSNDWGHPETDTPVPDRLLPKWKSKWLVNRLKLSQMIGLLIWLNREEMLSVGGKERLLYLQAKAPFSAIAAGLRFSERLTKESKLQSDFQPQMRELNRRPQSKRFRRYEVNRIGVGYRDKGALPENDSHARIKANSEAFVFLADFPDPVVALIRDKFPNSIEGEWLDLDELDQTMKIADLSPKDRQLLFHR